MASTQTQLTQRPGSRLEIGKSFFGPNVQEVKVEKFRSYFEYYIEELELLRSGISEETWQINSLGAQTYEDVFYIVEILRKNGNLRRPELRLLLKPRFQTSDHLGLDRSINLAVRLWLMINMQELHFEGIRHQASCVQWDDETPLREFFRNLFPQSRWQITARSSRLGPHFTAAFMHRIRGLKIEWTTSLYDHLRLDRQRKALKIFPYKCQLQAMIESCKSQDDRDKYEHLTIV